MDSEAGKQIQADFGIVGRGAELRLALAALGAGRNLMLEGPVGVGKSVLAEALAGHFGRTLQRVDGDERYTEQKMTGWFDPALVLEGGYKEEYFIQGPLVQAMLSGGVLFVNEINRMPESVQNVLLPAMEERRVVIPQYGEVRAEDAFSVIATQNPVEFVATSHLSEALVDRFEFVQLDYQAFDEEVEIVRRHTRLDGLSDADAGELIRQCVAMARATRTHPKVRRGASVRAAMGMAEIAARLDGADALQEAALVALLHRVETAEESGLSPETVIMQIVEDIKKKTTVKQ